MESTRGQVVRLLRRGEATVNELSLALELTDNAVRSHLTSLERDGLVQESGKRPGVRKPEMVYRLTPQAEELFPKSYHVVVGRLLDTLGDHLSADEIQQVLREAGRRIGASSPAADGTDELSGRVERILEIVKQLGGLAESSSDNRQVLGLSCPVGVIARDHPDICKLIESLLEEAIGVPVREQCDRSGRPRCIFQIG